MAVTIDLSAEGGSLASVMKKLSGSINHQSLGVEVLTTRKTRAGGILLEVEGNEKSTLLAGKIRKVVGDAARVRLPEPRSPVLLLGVPEWTEAEDVVAGVTQAGVTGVTSENVTIRKNSGERREFVASLHWPLKDTITLAEKKAVTLELTRCRVKLLANNQPTCFRCQGKRHLAAECRDEAKSRRCHRCKKDDYLKLIMYLTESQNVSKFNEFTTYINSNSEKFHCYISVWKFLLKEFAKYCIPFLSDLPKVELIVYEDVL
ncbi:hypothetical protein QTP88_003805 [Uroleucon formosanum]